MGMPMIALGVNEYLRTTVRPGFTRSRIDKRLTDPKPHTTHTYCFPVFVERKGDASLVLFGLRCECGEIRNRWF
jgi:hypothetical protein